MAQWTSLSRAIHLVVCSLLDMRALMPLRQTSKANLDLVGAALGQSLEQLVEGYVPDALEFLNLLTARSCYVGGEVALRFMLRRDATFKPSQLDIFVSPEHYLAIESHLVDYQGALQGRHDNADGTNTRDLEDRGQFAMSYFETPVGTVVLHSSCTADALVPISRAWCTLEVTYANLTHIGTGYPTLLFGGRGLLGDGVRDETERVHLAHRRGLDVRLMPDQWPDLQLTGCGRVEWVCPTQPRSMVDRGAMCVRLFPLETGRIEASNMWRMDTRPCGGPCLHDQSPWGLGSHEKFIAG